MNDMARWLEFHGLERYLDVFLDNELTLDVVPELTDEDLRELGLPMGPRKQLMKLIREGIEPPTSELPARRSNPEPTQLTGAAERRQLTVMFVDLVGSSALSETLDAEDYRDLLTAYQSAATRVIETHGGFVARYMGDGLLVYFGYPSAHENDPERATRAGLELVEAVATIESTPALSVRVGIATGPVIVGDIVGEGASEEAAALGETPNLAARLQASATPGTVVLSQTTQTLVNDVVVAQALPMVDIRGFAKPIERYQALGARTLEEASARSSDATPLIGREVEVALCQRAWSQAQAGDGQALLLVGEAGVGKSRLLRAFQDGLDNNSYTRVQWHCSPYHQATANYPAIDALQRSVRASHPQGNVDLSGLEQLVGSLGLDAQTTVPALAGLLGIATTDNYPKVAYTPDELKRRLTRAQVELLLAAASRAPVLLLVEDLHWVDATTLDVLNEMVAAATHAPVLVLMTARPGVEAPWSTRPNAASHHLRALSRQETATLVRTLVEHAGLSAELVEQIAMRTDGVPLFIEELTRNTLESGADASLPASLRDSLMARLDRLGTVKELAQVASVVGRTFDEEALVQMSGRSITDLQADLKRLVESDLVHARAGRRYEFKHALVRDAAYDSMLRSRKQALHARYATALQDSADHPELLARHLEAAGLTEDAIAQWNRAGDIALGRAAQREATSHFERALKLFHSVERATPKDEEELAILWRLGRAQFGSAGGGSPQARQTFARASTLTQRSGSPLDQIQALYGVWVGQMIAGDMPAALTTAREVNTISAQGTERWPQLIADRLVGTSLYHLGELEEGRRTLLRVVETNPDTVDGSGSFSHHPYLSAIASLSLNEWLLGYPLTAITRVDKLVAHLNPETDDLNTIAHALIWQIQVLVLAREQSALPEPCRSLASLAHRCGAPFWAHLAGVGEGASAIRSGDPAAGIDAVTTARRGMAATGSGQIVPLYYLVEAEGHIALLDWPCAMATLDEAGKLISDTSQLFYLPDLHRLRGDVLAQTGKLEAAQHAYGQALNIARSQSSRSFELRAATAMARLLVERGDRGEARAVLAPIYAWFTEGFDLPDLVDAAQMLAALESN